VAVIVMVVGFTTTYIISAHHHWCCEFLRFTITLEKRSPGSAPEYNGQKKKYKRKDNDLRNIHIKAPLSTIFQLYSVG
jgi:hypothetical protein